MVKDNYNKYLRLREEFKLFTYEGFTIVDKPEFLDITYIFNLNDIYFFNPSLYFRKSDLIQKQLSANAIENLVFHIGLIELISYWKTACSPNVLIKPFKLGHDQIRWWKNIWFQGLGEFFYLNKIPADSENFVEIISDSKKKVSPFRLIRDERQVLVPIGGGKDSAVTIELLKDRFHCVPFILNPRRASLGTVEKAGYQRTAIIEAERTLDPQLFRLNETGFLNGHTPFSALLAFISILVAGLSGAKFIALSNESSANEPTDAISGVNHQYSKSFEFESDFRSYVKSWITEDINYFSFLRPLNEIGIARIFSGLHKYHDVFKSCNAGSKSNSWCGKCPKCLFTFIVLSLFIDKTKLKEIFGKNLFDDHQLLPVFNELTGLSDIKPFECVGTIDEVNYSVCQAVKMYDHPLPGLLDYYVSSSAYLKYRDYQIDFDRLNPNHFLGEEMLLILKNAACK
ncbi:MAG: hypothetical protein FJY07_02345 [Bacteroidetes bacterium]|nr:hypothetical protein [Bacteroidota bacterium]